MRYNKVLKAFRFRDDQVAMLNRLAKKLEMNQTEVIMLALHKLAMHVFPKG